MTKQEQWEELAFFELANGDSRDPLAGRWDEDDPAGDWDDFSDGE